MTKLELRFPFGDPIAADQLLAELNDEVAGGPLRVGDSRVVDFLVAIAKRLLAPSMARRFPELASLGFFMRRGELENAVSRATPSPGHLRSPRGVVFHIPPANVDTIFVYSWALSALAGNHNIVRISSRSAGAASMVLEVLNEAVQDAHPAIAQTQRMVTYGRDDAATAGLSLACDLRVIWGGDGTVTDIRRHPLRPSARDLTFPDRSSFAVISAAGWQAAGRALRREIAEGLYNDSFWFDQAACSSPRTLYWVGGPVAEAQDELFSLLAEVVAARATTLDTAMAIEKRVSTYGLAAEGTASQLRFDGNAIAVAQLTDPSLIPRRWLGVGTFPVAQVESLHDLVNVVRPRDQTVTHFGFTAAELMEFAASIAGRGVDRLVPIGEALSFSAMWDGYDLLREFTKLTTIKADTRSSAS